MPNENSLWISAHIVPILDVKSWQCSSMLYHALHPTIFPFWVLILHTLFPQFPFLSFQYLKYPCLQSIPSHLTTPSDSFHSHPPFLFLSPFPSLLPSLHSQTNKPHTNQLTLHNPITYSSPTDVPFLATFFETRFLPPFGAASIPESTAISAYHQSPSPSLTGNAVS